MSSGATSFDVVVEQGIPLTREEEEARIDALSLEMDEKDTERIRQETLSSDLKTFEKTDLGNSERFVRRYGRDILYCHPQRTWYIWDGCRWSCDEEGKIKALAKNTVRYIGDEAGLIEGESERSALYRWAASSQNHTRISGLIFLTESSVPVLPEQLDSKNNLFNCQNGTLDLTSLDFRGHNREDRCSKISGVRYDPDARCPIWEDHLKLVFGNDESFIQDFQTMAGSSLLADNPEQILFILHGSVKNGKSVTVSALSRVMGDYASNMAAESLMIKKNSDGPRSDLVKLAGARLITASESDSSHRLSESLIKLLTGGDTITARTLYQTEREYKISGKIWFSTNHKPIIKGTDLAIWRRLWLVPFEVTIPEDRRDLNIQEKLSDEGPGILNWMIEGLKRYRENGERLRMPERIALATYSYRTESDITGQFINDRCILDLKPESTISRAALYEQYVAWCKEMGEDPSSQKTFSNRLQEKGVTSKKSRGTRYWIGIREKTIEEINKNEHDRREGAHRGHIDTYFQESPYEENKLKVLGEPANVPPMCPPTTVPTNWDEVKCLFESVNGNPEKLTGDQKAAILKFWKGKGAPPDLIESVRKKDDDSDKGPNPPELEQYKENKIKIMG